MADFLVVRTSDVSARTPALIRWSASVGRHAGAVGGRLELGRAALHWNAAPGAPVSTWSGENAVALILGDAIDGDRGRLDARALAARVRDRTAPRDLALDGYFVGIVVGEDEIVVVSDILGLYPVYQGDQADFVASSIPLPRHGMAPDPEGLAGVLAFHGTVGQRSIAPGVRRVAAGHALVASSSQAEQVETFIWPTEETCSGLPIAEQDEMIREALTTALSRQLPAEGPVGMLLTGGRDSRLLAGLLQRRNRSIVARTVGDVRDHEVELARAVANRLGIPHEARPLPPDAIWEGVDLHIDTDHLASGIGHAYWRGARAALTDLPSHSVTGHLFDVIVGGAMRPTGDEPHGMGRPYEEVRRFERRGGVPDDVLARLATPILRDAWQWAEQEMRRDFESGPAPQRLWRWTLGHFGRFYIGMALQPISLETWPIVPVLDRDLIELASRLDSRAIADRRAQDRMLRDHFPELASIPHTWLNAAPQSPIRPTLWHRMRDRVRRGSPLPGPLGWRHDRRFVYRNTDFQNPGWQRVHQAAHEHRSLLHGILDRDALDEYLPPPGGRLARVDFASNQGPKLLNALALWLDRFAS